MIILQCLRPLWHSTVFRMKLLIFNTLCRAWHGCPLSAYLHHHMSHAFLLCTWTSEFLKSPNQLPPLFHSVCFFLLVIFPWFMPILLFWDTLAHFLLEPFCPIKADLILFCVHSMTLHSIRHSMTLFSGLTSTLYQLNYMKQKMQI